MLVEFVKDNNYAIAIIGTEKDTLVFYSTQIVDRRTES